MTPAHNKQTYMLTEQEATDLCNAYLAKAEKAEKAGDARAAEAWREAVKMLRAARDESFRARSGIAVQPAPKLVRNNRPQLVGASDSEL